MSWAVLLLLLAPMIVYLQPRKTRGYRPWLPPSRAKRAIRTLQLSLAAALVVVGVVAALSYLGTGPTDAMHIGIGPHEPEPMVHPTARAAALTLSGALLFTQSGRSCGWR